MVYLFALPTAAVLYAHDATLRGWVPVQFDSVPLTVPFFGALGGVYVSLTGIFFHEKNWDSTYDLWHALRPFTAALAATVAYLIFIVVVDSTGAKAQTHGGLTYNVLGFLVGYREKTFRDLLKTSHRQHPRARRITNG